MDYQAVMFDLDGTLADTLADIAAAGNHALKELGHAPLPTDRYRYLAGQGLRYLVEHALGPDHRHQVEAGVALVEEYYAAHQFALVDHFPQMSELLDALVERGYTLAVLSNKPHAAVEEVLRRYFGRWRFDAVQGHEAGRALKPDAQAALELAGQVGIPPERWVYVGDTAADMQTGSGAAMLTVGVLWGFREEAELREHGADVVVSEPMELLRVVEGRGVRSEE